MIFFLLGRACNFHIIIFLLMNFLEFEVDKVATSNVWRALIIFTFIRNIIRKLHHYKKILISYLSISDSRWYWYHIITYINFIVQCQIRTFIVHKNITFPYIEKIIVHVSLFMLQQFSFSLNRKGVQWVISKAAINIFLVVTECFIHRRCFHRDMI